MTTSTQSKVDWFIEKLRGDNIILRMSATSHAFGQQRANIARGETFAYYSDAEMPLACHILYRAWVEPDGKTYRYELTQTPFPHWTAEWDDTIEKLTKGWARDWLSEDNNVFTLIKPNGRVRVNSHPTVLTHLSRMHGMLLGLQDDPFATVLRDIATRRIDGAIRKMNSDWAQTLGM